MTRVEERSAIDREPSRNTATAGPLRVLAGRFVPHPRRGTPGPVVPAPRPPLDDAELCALAFAAGVMGA